MENRYLNWFTVTGTVIRKRRRNSEQLEIELGTSRDRVKLGGRVRVAEKKEGEST